MEAHPDPGKLGSHQAVSRRKRSIEMQVAISASVFHLPPLLSRILYPLLQATCFLSDSVTLNSRTQNSKSVEERRDIGRSSHD